MDTKLIATKKHKIHKAILRFLCLFAADTLILDHDLRSLEVESKSHLLQSLGAHRVAELRFVPRIEHQETAAARADERLQSSSIVSHQPKRQTGAGQAVGNVVTAPGRKTIDFPVRQFDREDLDIPAFLRKRG